MNVALYMRYSSAGQSEQSIDGQLRVLTDYCDRNGHAIVRKYIDRATSASKDTEKRLQFLQMIKDSEDHLFDAVIVYKLDRFARDRYDSAIYKSKLKKNGVFLISATENLSSENPESIILESVLEGYAEYFSKELSQKVKRGMNESAIKCQFLGGYVPLGYKIVDHKFEIDESTAHIVREAFDRYANGETMISIINDFNSRGFHTSTGGEFKPNSFHALFKNEKYIGIYEYHGNIVEDAVPAIIDRDIYEKVQQRMRGNMRSPARSKAKIEYLLSGKLFCGHCQGRMVGESARGRNGNTYYYYSCQNRKERKQNKCDKKPIKKDLIENAVVEDVLSIMTPEKIDELAEMAIRANEEEIAANQIIPALESEIKECDKQINNLLKLVSQGCISENLTQMINDIEKRKESLKQQLEEEKHLYVKLEKSHVVYFLTMFTHGDIEDLDFKRKLIDTLVNSVTVYDRPDGFDLDIILNTSTDSNRTVFVSNEASSAVPQRDYSNIIVLNNLICIRTSHRR